MKIAQLFHYIKNYLLRFFQLQLFITLISFPILLCWGLPISLLSPIGNLVFSPILTLFLLVSSLVFFTELLYVPNGFIITCLQKIVHFWLYVMNIDGSRWLFGFAKPSMLVLILIPSFALIILQHRWFRNIYLSIMALIGLFLLSILIIKSYYTQNNRFEQFPCNRGAVSIMYTDQGAVIIDPGVIGQKISAPSWIEYTLIPHLITSNGCNKICAIIILQPSSLTFQALTTLVEKIPVKKIYMPWWKGTLQKHTWSKFFAMKRILMEHNVCLYRYGDKELDVAIDDAIKINVQVLPSVISYQECEYCAYRVVGLVEDKSFEVTSYKYVQKKSVIDQLANVTSI